MSSGISLMDTCSQQPDGKRYWQGRDPQFRHENNGEGGAQFERDASRLLRHWLIVSALN
jgi:hypothetical protein